MDIQRIGSEDFFLNIGSQWLQSNYISTSRDYFGKSIETLRDYLGKLRMSIDLPLPDKSICLHLSESQICIF